MIPFAKINDENVNDLNARIVDLVRGIQKEGVELKRSYVTDHDVLCALEMVRAGVIANITLNESINRES
jgi:hypothetical protein